MRNHVEKKIKVLILLKWLISLRIEREAEEADVIVMEKCFKQILFKTRRISRDIEVSVFKEHGKKKVSK